MVRISITPRVTRAIWGRIPMPNHSRKSGIRAKIGTTRSASNENSSRSLAHRLYPNTKPKPRPANPPTTIPVNTICRVIQNAAGIRSPIAHHTENSFWGVGRRIGLTRPRLVMAVQTRRASTGRNKARTIRLTRPGRRSQVRNRSTGPPRSAASTRLSSAPPIPLPHLDVPALPRPAPGGRRIHSIGLPQWWAYEASARPPTYRRAEFIHTRMPSGTAAMQRSIRTATFPGCTTNPARKRSPRASRRTARWQAPAVEATSPSIASNATTRSTS